MAQHSDYNIANQGFPAFRTDLNNVLTAINTLNSGTSRPASAVANSLWLDTTTPTAPTLKYYDGADDISLATIDHVGNTVNWLDSTVVFDIVNDITPQLGGMLDVNGQAIGDGTLELIKFSETASAVNEITITNSATGNNPQISATGDDTNIGLSLATKGTGLIKFNDGAYNADATLTDGATITWDVGSSPVAKVTLGDNRTLSAPTNSVAGQFISIAVIQDGTGSRTLTWNSAYEFTGDVAPTLTTTASKADIFVFKYNGTVWLEVGRNLNLSIS
jgi:hypothetical protein